jgi:hypothetical protein
VQNILTMQKMLNQVHWEPSKMSPLVFIEKFGTLIDMYVAQGNEVNESTRNAYIYNALAAAQDSAYGKDITKALDEEQPLKWLLDRLSRTNSQLGLNDSLKKSNGSKGKSPRSSQDAEFAGMAFEEEPEKSGKRPKSQHCHSGNCLSCGMENMALVTQAPPTFTGKKKCTQCGKKNHVKADCWANETCTKCGVKGHIERVCGIFSQPRVVSVVRSENVRPHGAGGGKKQTSFKV